MADPKSGHTIEELEKLIAVKGEGKIRLKPDGSIETIPHETVTKELFRLRKEHSRLVVDLSEAIGKIREVTQALKEILSGW